MAQRRWTVMIIPHGSDSPRTVAVTERIIKVLLSVAGGAVLVLLAGVGIAVASMAGFENPLASRENRRLQQELADVRARISVLQDTLASIDKRDDQIRLLAGLPSTDSSDTDSSSAASLSFGASVPQPVVNRLGFGPSIDIDGLIRRANTLSASFAEVSDTLSRNIERMKNTPSIMPTAGWLTSHFSRNRFHPILHVGRPHEGIDVAAPYGAPVVAPAAGVVSEVTRQTGYGLVVEINHGNGIVTKYAHLSRAAVREGQRVTRGQVFANVGNSGLSTGPHLHYEIHINGRVIDPLSYVLPGAIPD